MPRPLLLMPKIASESVMPPEQGDQWYLEHTNGHSKFYEVTIRDESSSSKGKPYVVITRHGRIGVNGRILEYDRANTLDQARYLAQELVKTKLDKGYKQVKHTRKEATATKKSSDQEMTRFGKIDWE